MSSHVALVNWSGVGFWTLSIMVRLPEWRCVLLAPARAGLHATRNRAWMGRDLVVAARPENFFDVPRQHTCHSARSEESPGEAAPHRAHRSLWPSMRRLHRRALRAGILRLRSG